MSKKTRFHNVSDLLIWQAFKAGEVEAFDFIFNTYVNFLFNYGDKISKNEALVEDTIQELFIELWEKRENLGEVNAIKYYLIKSLQRKLLRKLQQNPLMISEEDSTIQSNEAFIEFSYETQLIQLQTSQEQRGKLQKALDQLSEKQRQALFYKFYDQLSYEEIAQLMSSNVKAIYDLIYQALKSLKKTFTVWLFFLLQLFVIGN